MADGRRDIVLVTENGGTVEADGVKMAGRVGLGRFVGEQVVKACLVEGTLLAAKSMRLNLPKASIAGRIVGWDESDSMNTLLKLNTPVSSEALGKYIVIDNSERSDASYRIEEVVNERTVSIGSNSLVERFRNKNDYSKGVIYNIAKGDRFRIPLSKSYECPENSRH